LEDDEDEKLRPAANKIKLVK